MEDTVSSKTLRPRGEPLAEKIKTKHNHLPCLDPDFTVESFSFQPHMLHDSTGVNV